MNNLKKQDGASILEFLIVIPILLLLAFTAVEFGAVFTRYNTVTKSVQDAARYLSTDKSKVNAKKDKAKNLIEYGSLTTETKILPGTFEFPSSFPNITNENHVIVSVTYKHEPVMGQTLNNLLGLITGTKGTLDLSIDLTATSVMRYVK